MKLLDSDVDVERLFLRKRVMSHIVNVVLVKKLLIDNPGGIRNNFIHPSDLKMKSNSNSNSNSNG